MKQSSKRFVFSSEALNSKKFRVKSSGVDVSQYNLNPQLLWMHTRPEGKKDDTLPLGNGINLKLDEDGKWRFTPAFDDTDDFAMKIYNKVENGTLRMCSAGLGKPWEFEEIDGEIWLTKSRLVEISICDTGSNDEALASEIELYDEEDQRINLTASHIKTLIPKTNIDMSKITLDAAKALNMVELTEGSTGEEFLGKVEEAIQLTKTQKNQIVTLTKERDEALEAKESAEGEVKKLKASNEDAELIKLVDEAEKVGKILPETRKKILGEEEGSEKMSLAHAKAMLDLLPATKTAEQTLTEEGIKGDEFLKSVKDKTYAELNASEQLIELKAKHPEVFKQKYKEHFGKDYIKA